ncbi:MAG: hypothetical protein IPG07_07105 [Crocinitomicaceae bacterium]|nr:hypothetical protein [Crocinitomicaceae bacterium]
MSSSLAQDTTTAKIDSLIMLLMNDSEDPAKVDVYNALSDEYLNLNYQKINRIHRFSCRSCVETGL